MNDKEKARVDGLAKKAAKRLEKVPEDRYPDAYVEAKRSDIEWLAGVAAPQAATDEEREQLGEISFGAANAGSKPGAKINLCATNVLFLCELASRGGESPQPQVLPVLPQEPK